VFAVLAVCLLAAAAASALTTVTGKTAGGAFYRIDMPAEWNGTLVIFNHGWEITPPAPVTFMGPEPLPERQLAAGFAVAASSYQLNGFAVFKTRTDLKNLVAAFTKRFGKPQQILIYGESMGSLVSLDALEVGKLGKVTGVLSLCGMLGGSVPTATHIADLRLIYDVVCQDVPEAFLPGAATGLPKGFPLDEQTLALAVDACTGILAPPSQRTAAQADRLRRILEETTIPEDFLVPDMWFATVGVRDVAFGRGKAGPGAVGNLGVAYADREVEEEIERVRVVAKAATRLRQFYTPTGKGGQAKVLALHFDQDGLLFVENLSEYGKRANPGRFTPVVVAEGETDGANHCHFSPAERVAAWEELVAWAGGGAQPSAFEVQARCTDLLGEGVAGPCRIDPGFSIGDLYSRVKRR
jgi:hypothetical protein